MREFAAAEAAKRRVVFQLLELELPGVAPGQLSFDLLSSARTSRSPPGTPTA